MSITATTETTPSPSPGNPDRQDPGDQQESVSQELQGPDLSVKSIPTATPCTNLSLLKQRAVSKSSSTSDSPQSGYTSSLSSPEATALMPIDPSDNNAGPSRGRASTSSSRRSMSIVDEKGEEPKKVEPADYAYEYVPVVQVSIVRFHMNSMLMLVIETGRTRGDVSADSLWSCSFLLCALPLYESSNPLSPLHLPLR